MESLFDLESVAPQQEMPKMDPDARLYVCPRCDAYCHHTLSEPYGGPKEFKVKCRDCGYFYAETQKD